MFENGRWLAGNAAYDALVVPYAEYLPQFVLDGLETLREHGITVIEVDRATANAPVEVVPLERLAGELIARGKADITLETPCPLLRYMHQEKAGGSHLFMFFNEATDRRAETIVHLPVRGAYTLLDWQGGKVCSLTAEDGRVSVSLAPYESVVLVFDGEGAAESAAEPALEAEALDALWTIETADCTDMTRYALLAENSPLRTVERDVWDFAGRIRYTAQLDDLENAAALELDEVGDSAQVYLNGQCAGHRICPPYRFDLSGLGKNGDNTLEIVVSTTLARRQRDQFSTFVAMNRPGLGGRITLWRKK